MSDYLLQHGTRGPTDQRDQARDDQVANSDGGYVWAVDCWTRLRRFLILGAEGGTYYIGERELATQNIKSIRECLTADGTRTVDTIVEVSRDGKAAKNDPALFALAVAISHGNLETRKYAARMLPLVARIGTHLFHFVAYAETQRGWGKTLRWAVENWYRSKDAGALAYDVVKYRQRDGWTHRDLMRLGHPVGRQSRDEQSPLSVIFDFVTHNTWEPDAFPILDGYVKATTAKDPAETAALVRQYNLPREALLTEHLTDPEVWRAMLEKGMPIHALTRNLGNMTRYGILTGDPLTTVIDTLRNEEQIRRSRLHPFALLLAITTYRAGRGVRGGNSWTPIDAVTDALNDAYYLSFGNVTRTGKRILQCLDVSGSMAHSLMDSHLTCAIGSAALALITASVEPETACVTFSPARFTPSATARRSPFSS